MDPLVTLAAILTTVSTVSRSLIALQFRGTEGHR